MSNPSTALNAIHQRPACSDGPQAHRPPRRGVDTYIGQLVEWAAEASDEHLGHALRLALEPDSIAFTTARDGISVAWLSGAVGVLVGKLGGAR